MVFTFTVFQYSFAKSKMVLDIQSVRLCKHFSKVAEVRKKRFEEITKYENKKGEWGHNLIPNFP